MSATCKQQLVTYQPHGGTAVPYSTAYGDDERTVQVMHCTVRYGLAATVSVGLASDLPVQA